MSGPGIDPDRLAIAVHGGAFAIPPDEREAHRLGCRRALERGWQVLLAGGSSLDAVEQAVRVLEDDGTFDAGRGSFLDEDGNVSLDAGIMDGRTLATGSVVAAIGVPNAVTLARRVLESPHAVIVGPGARRFAEAHGVAVCEPEEMVGGSRWRGVRTDRATRRVPRWRGAAASGGVELRGRVH